MRVNHYPLCANKRICGSPWMGFWHRLTRAHFSNQDVEDIWRGQHVFIRTQEVLTLDMRTHFGFLLNGYTLHYPQPSQFALYDPFEGGGEDGET